MEGLTVATVRGEWLATGPRGSPTPRGRLLEEPARAPSTGRFRSFVELAEVVRRSAITVFFAFARARREFRDVFSWREISRQCTSVALPGTTGL